MNRKKQKPPLDIEHDEETAQELLGNTVAASAHPQCSSLIAKTRGPQQAATNEMISIRQSPDVLEHVRGQGPGWQSKNDDVLREAVDA